MRILAADTSTARISLALSADGEIIEINQSMESPSAARFWMLLDALLMAADTSPGAVDCLAIGSGPGSFTGLRVSFAAFRTLAWARALPLYPVCSLEAAAFPYRSLDASLVVRVPARRGQVYQCAFNRGRAIQELALVSCGEAAALARALPEPRFLLGPADAEDPGLAQLAGEALPGAASIVRLARETRAPAPKLEEVLPLYLRASDAELAFMKKLD